MLTPMKRLTPKTIDDLPAGLTGENAEAWLRGVNGAITAANARPDRVLGEAPEYFTREQARVWALED